MAIIKSVNGILPILGEETWVAENATIVGEVVTGTNCSIWFQAVVRGDVGAIVFGDDVNIQDGAVVHCTTGKSAVRLGNRVSVGHRALVHGCTTEDDVLVGMGAIIMDNAYIERGSIIAAGAVVLENERVKAGTIWAGVPAKQVKERDIDTAVREIRKTAEAYKKYKTWYEGEGIGHRAKKDR